MAVTMKFAALVWTMTFIVAACSDGEEEGTAPTLTPPPSVDTSDWPVYENETFSMRYPPSWHVEVENLTPGYVYFRNDDAQAAQATREAEGPPHFLTEGEAQIAVGASLFMRFGLETLIENCTDTVSNTTFAGLPATQCGDDYWVELPSSGLIGVSRTAHEVEPKTEQLLDAALATIAFHE